MAGEHASITELVPPEVYRFANDINTLFQKHSAVDSLALTQPGVEHPSFERHFTCHIGISDTSKFPVIQLTDGCTHWGTESTYQFDPGANQYTKKSHEYEMGISAVEPVSVSDVESVQEYELGRILGIIQALQPEITSAHATGQSQVLFGRRIVRRSPQR